MKQVAICVFVIFVIGCGERFYNVPAFTSEELMWVNPFDQNDTIIYISERNEADTVIFFKTTAESNSTRSINTGFVNTNYLTVPYSFSPGSYHQSALMSDGGHRYDHHFVVIEKSSTGTNSLEITFIGTFFSDEQLQNIEKISDSLYYFNSQKATYSGMNVEKEINDFTFHVGKGIVAYTDARGVKWKRL